MREKMDILRDLAAIYSKLPESDQSHILETLGGKRLGESLGIILKTL